MNSIIPKLIHAHYMMIIDASSGYQSLYLDNRSPYLTTFACQSSRCRFTRLPFRVPPLGDMFQWKIDEIFKVFPNVFIFVDDILL